MRPSLVPLALAALAALALSLGPACVDTERPAGTPADVARPVDAGQGDAPPDAPACVPARCPASEVPVDKDGDGCPEACDVQSCAGPCDCPQPTRDESDELCPAPGWPGFGLYRDCDGGTCRARCGPIPTPVINCAAPPGTCDNGPECAPWERPLVDPLTGCVTQCDTRCERDCDCYAALGDPDDTCGGLKTRVWRCDPEGHTCGTVCESLSSVLGPDCHGKSAEACDTSKGCGEKLGDGRRLCARPPGMCGDHDKGTCTKGETSTAGCPSGPPVCGCDDQRYDSACHAAAAGVSVRGPAAMCPVPVGG